MTADSSGSSWHAEEEEALVRWVNYAGLIKPAMHGRIAQVSQAAVDLAELCRGFHELIGQVMSVDGMVVVLCDSSARTWHYAYGGDQPGWSVQTRGSGRGLIDHVLRTGKPLLASRENVRAMIRSGEVEWSGPIPVDWLGVPMMTGGQALGVLSVLNQGEAGRLSERESDMLAFLALRLAQAVMAKRMEFELQETRGRLRRLMNSSPTVIYSCKPAGDYDTTFISENVALHLGYEAKEFLADARFWSERLHPEDAPRLLAAFSRLCEQEHQTHEYRFRHKDGTYRWVRDELRLTRDETGNPLEIVGSLMDMTERRVMEIQLRQAQKMEAIGTLAGGIAHDFNNILCAILGYAEMVREDLPDGSSGRKNVQEVLKAGYRARNLVRQILEFSRQPGQGRKHVALRSVVKEALDLLRASLPSTIDIRSQFNADADTVLADPDQIHQVMMNLGANAGHAMREQGGMLEVNLDCMVVDRDFAAAHKGLTPGLYLLLQVSDTGCGMAPEIVGRIFDPFFTTKGVGEGTGMGLSIVHGIVASHGGHISVYSEPGLGTTFHVYLPQVRNQASPEPAIDVPGPRGTGRVLFVDDEPALVAMGRQRLERLGYTVVGTTSSIEALESFRSDPNVYDVVITDQTMPKMPGDALAQEILRIRPETPIILCSGFSHTMTVEKARAMGIVEYLMKPVATLALAEAIRRVLERPPQKGGERWRGC